MVSCSAALMVKGMTALIFPGGYPANSLPRVVINGPRVMGSYYARSLKVTEANSRLVRVRRYARAPPLPAGGSTRRSTVEMGPFYAPLVSSYE